ncbi:MAG: 4-hydroxy-tetrahydrodipicolinate reductase [Myxococcaceae bacterium]|nr:4-hydroxy-tetrahydrodipicolinate reductase [Myxococcaceae bacterium]
MSRVLMKLIICGAAGRMGQALVAAAKALGHTVVAGVEKKGVAVAGIETTDALKPAGADCVIDFTAPEVSLENARTCAAAKVPIVIGTTGFSTAQRAELEKLGGTAPIVVAPNMSVGVNVVIGMAAELAKRLGEDFDVEILETHHKRKKDAPSGTALKLAEEIASATKRTKSDFRLVREGQIGERPEREIGVQTLRGGDVVGEHTIYFFGDGERVELSHRATSRDQFARGAMRAAAWLQGKGPGLYDMRHVLGFL